MSVLSLVEMLLFNIFTVDYYCHRKYSLCKTTIVLLLSSIIPFGIGLALHSIFPYIGNGEYMLLGFVFLIPLSYLYRERNLLIFVIMCTCWTYTLGIFAISQQIVKIFIFPAADYHFIIQTLLLAVTAWPYYKFFVPKYLFALNNMEIFEKNWYLYMGLGNCLNFLVLALLCNIFIDYEGSVAALTALILIFVSVHVSYYILYKIVYDSLKLNHLKEAASHDALTGLGNRSYFWEYLHSLISSDQTFSVLFMDLDRFKQINDQYGHVIGDEYLKHFAQISSSILDSNGKMFRFGGDEFIAIYQGQVSENIVERLRECRGWEKGAPCPFNQVSIGVLYCQPPHKDEEEILQQVGKLMYQKKLQKAAQK